MEASASGVDAAHANPAGSLQDAGARADRKDRSNGFDDVFG